MALFLYHVVFGVRYLGILNGVAAFVIIGIGKLSKAESNILVKTLIVFFLLRLSEDDSWLILRITEMGIKAQAQMCPDVSKYVDEQLWEFVNYLFEVSAGAWSY